MYERHDWDWKDREKHKEMMDYLSSLGKNSSVHVALPLFRFDVVCRDEVLYHYEVQMESKMWRKGLGKLLIQSSRSRPAAHRGRELC